MRMYSGMSGGPTFVQFLPPSRVTWIRPSSEPVQMRFSSRGDGARVNTVAYVSTPVWSSVIGPPDGPSVFGSARVRSGLMRSQLAPSLVERQTCCELVYRMFGFFGEKTIGNVHWKRSLMSLAE